MWCIVDVKLPRPLADDTADMWLTQLVFPAWRMTVTSGFQIGILSSETINYTDREGNSTDRKRSVLP